MPKFPFEVPFSLVPLDLKAFADAAANTIRDVERKIGHFHITTCGLCGKEAPVKYFLWIKTQDCPASGKGNDLFAGYLRAEAERHPKHVIFCHHCGHLNEYVATHRG